MKRRFLEDTWRREPSFRALCNALRSCKTDEEMENLLRDIGTLSELKAWSERLEVAKLLAKGLSYRQVADATKASTTTVTRVAKFIENGTGGYRRALRVHRHYRDVMEPQLKPKIEKMVPTPATEPQIPGPEASTPPVDLPRPSSVLQKYLERR